jgi:hypothetical protein
VVDDLLRKDGYVRGGLDDALDKLARRDELRRRAAGEATGTSPAVTELMEAIAAVVARHPAMGVTVGVEGAGDPLLLRFHFADGQVQVNADTAIGSQPDETSTPRHADFEIDLDDETPAEPAGEHRRADHNDQDQFGAATSGYGRDEHRYAEPETVEHRYAEPETVEHRYAEQETVERRFAGVDPPSTPVDPRYATPAAGESSQDLGARLRDLGMARSHQPDYPRHPFAATPPPEVPPQVSPQPTPASATPPPPRPSATPPPPRPTVPLQPDRGRSDRAQADYQQTRRIHPEHYRAPAEPAAADRIPPGHPLDPQQRGSYPVSPHSGGPYAGSAPDSPYPSSARADPFPASSHPENGGARSGGAQPGVLPKPLPKPIPLQVERPEETEMAARRVAALLRDDPSLLNQPPE